MGGVFVHASLSKPVVMNRSRTWSLSTKGRDRGRTICISSPILFTRTQSKRCATEPRRVRSSLPSGH
ncbi:Uncharacterised protein [Mycobacteroides abscessus subsp. abscessus]|nr:Uncharacterised protein [Mycobacteroides abscessus subsp. abscessus]